MVLTQYLNPKIRIGLYMSQKWAIKSHKKTNRENFFIKNIKK
jgi:hypothetical protein